MTAEQLIDIGFDKISALSGIIFTSVAMVLVRVIFIGADGSMLIKMVNMLACLITGILTGYLVHDVSSSIVIVCGSTATTTLFADKLIRKIYEQGPDLVWDALKQILNSFVDKIKSRNNKEQ